MDLKMAVNWVLTFTPEEVVLLSKALRGTLSLDEVPSARKLAHDLARLRHAHSEHMAVEMKKHCNKADTTDV
jgi:hypothetical protein